MLYITNHTLVGPNTDAMHYKSNTDNTAICSYIFYI